MFPTIASRFNDPGVNRLFAAICAALDEKKVGAASWQVGDVGPTELTARDPLIPGSRMRYLAEIAQAGREANARVDAQAAGGKPRARSLSSR